MLYGESRAAPAIDLDSVEAQIVADAMELGMSYQLSTNLLNVYCEQNGEEPYSTVSIQTAVANLKPKYGTLRKRKQGHLDANSHWSKS